MPTKTIVTSSEAATAAAIGRELASALSAGSVVLLSGNLGAGKTAFVRGLAEGLGVASEAVSSPTFTIIQGVRGGRAPLFHVDLYRLEWSKSAIEISVWTKMPAAECPDNRVGRQTTRHLPDGAINVPNQSRRR